MPPLVLGLYNVANNPIEIKIKLNHACARCLVDAIVMGQVLKAWFPSGDNIEG